MTESPTAAPLRTVLMADSAMAQPTLDALIRGGRAVGLCSSQASLSGAILQKMSAAAGVPAVATTRADLSGSTTEWVRSLQPDVLLVFTFPYRLPRVLLDVPRLGGYNLHGGKLPQCRGPQPAFWEIAECQGEGAMTIHRLDDEFDRGPIVLSLTMPIAPEDTYGLHLVRLAFAAAQVTEALFAGLAQYGPLLPTQPQDETLAVYRRKPTREDLIIDWATQTGARIRGLVKAGNPWNNGAIASIRGLELRITDVTLRPGAGDARVPPGTILQADVDAGVLVNCSDGSALLLDVVSMDEGILPGRALAALGIGAGERFVRPGQP